MYIQSLLSYTTLLPAWHQIFSKITLFFNKKEHDSKLETLEITHAKKVDTMLLFLLISLSTYNVNKSITFMVWFAHLPQFQAMIIIIIILASKQTAQDCY